GKVRWTESVDRNTVDGPGCARGPEAVVVVVDLRHEPVDEEMRQAGREGAVVAEHVHIARGGPLEWAQRRRPSLRGQGPGHRVDVTERHRGGVHVSRAQAAAVVGAALTPTATPTSATNSVAVPSGWMKAAKCSRYTTLSSLPAPTTKITLKSWQR